TQKGRRSTHYPDDTPGLELRAGTTSTLPGGPLVDDAPDAATFVVGDVERSVWSQREAGWTVGRAIWLLVRAREAIGEDLELRRVDGLTCRERDKRYVVPSLWSRRTVPRPVKCDESAAVIVGREFRARVEHDPVRRPMRGKERLRPFLGCAL